MTLLDAPAVAKLLVEIGQRLSLAGENPYKARSYFAWLGRYDRNISYQRCPRGPHRVQEKTYAIERQVHSLMGRDECQAPARAF
jgi:hypothetical protein